MKQGIFFCGSGFGLLSYSLISYKNAFNKSWAQSPYLFPMIVSLALIGLSVWLMGESRLKAKREAAVPEKEKSVKTQTGEKRRWVIMALILCAAYYAALAMLKIPYVMIDFGAFVYTFSTFEVVTVAFLASMMAFMGVKKPFILLTVPLGTTLFLSLAFRTFLHVLLP